MTRIVPAFTDEQKAAFIAAARTMLGRPFRHQGRTLDGMDCIGFLGLSVVAASGIALKPRTDYGRLPAHKKLERELTAHLGEPLVLGRLPSSFELQPAQVVTSAWEVESNHVAIVVPHPERGVGLIHCYAGQKKVVEHGIDPIWRARITGVWSP